MMLQKSCKNQIIKKCMISICQWVSYQYGKRNRKPTAEFAAVGFAVPVK